MVGSRPLPVWLAIPWWWLLFAQFVEYAIRTTLQSLGFFSAAPDVGSWAIAAWLLLQAGWLWTVDRRSRAWIWYVAGLVFDPLIPRFERLQQQHLGQIWWIAAVAAFVASLGLNIAGIFVFRRELRRYVQETTGVLLNLRWWMCLLFSVYYFQYQFHAAARFEAWRSDVRPERV